MIYDQGKEQKNKEESHISRKAHNLPGKISRKTDDIPDPGELQKLADNSPQVKKTEELQKIADNSHQVKSSKIMQRMAGDYHRVRPPGEFQQTRYIQAKYKISHPSDPAEQEANRVAETIVQNRTIGPGVMKSPSITDKSSKGPGIYSLSNKTLDNVHEGKPLSESEKYFFEPHFGADLNEVRIHTDSRSAAIAESINAKAFTRGHNIVFNKGEYQPETKTGKKLMAHELTHVMQQGEGIFREENTNYQSTEYYKNLYGPGEESENISLETNLQKGPLLESYKSDAEKLLTFKLETLYQWINIVTRAQVTGGNGQGSEERALELRHAAETVNYLGAVVWQKRGILSAMDDLIKYHVPPEGSPSPDISWQTTTGSRNYIRGKFNRENLLRLGYPEEISGFLDELDSLGVRPSVTEDEISDHIRRTASRGQLLEAGWNHLKRSGNVIDWGAFAEPRYEWKTEELEDDKIIEIGKQHIHEDETLRLNAQLVLDIDPGRTAPPEETALLDIRSVDPPYNYDALRFVANRLRTKAEMEYLSAREALEIQFDRFPLLRMYVSNWNIFLNEIFQGSEAAYHNLINIADISPGNLVSKLEHLLDEINKLKEKVKNDEAFLFDSAIYQAVEPIISEYSRINPEYGQWINDKFKNRKKWDEAIDTLLVIAGVVGFVAAEFLSMGWATLAAGAGAAAMAGVAVRSQRRSGLLNMTAHIGFSPKEEAALAEFKAWLDTAMAAVSVGQAALKGLTFFKFHYNYIRHATDAAGKAQSIMNGIDPQYLNPNSRFGAGFYVTRQGDTAIAELAAHNVSGKFMIRFRLNIFGEKVLNLTDPVIAARWGFQQGVTSTAACQKIAADAISQGYNVIVFQSYRGAGFNYVIYNNFDKILKPLSYSPIP